MEFPFCSLFHMGYARFFVIWNSRSSVITMTGVDSCRFFFKLGFSILGGVAVFACSRNGVLGEWRRALALGAFLEEGSGSLLGGGSGSSLGGSSGSVLGGICSS